MPPLTYEIALLLEATKSTLGAMNPKGANLGRRPSRAPALFAHPVAASTPAAGPGGGRYPQVLWSALWITDFGCPLPSQKEGLSDAG